jgi:hypothetical protein
LAANQTTPKNVANNKDTEIAICHHGTPKGIRISITIGDVKGIIEKTTAIVPWGLLITVKKPI